MKILWSVLGTIATLIVAAIILLYSGAYDIAASQPHTGPTRWALNTLKRRSVAAHAGNPQVPALTDSALISRGAGEYREMCATCHGAPGVNRAAIGKGITPEPPDLAKVGPTWSDAELHWILQNGIKLAGMPAFGGTHDDRTIWGMVAFVRQLPHMSPADYDRITKAAAEEDHDEMEHEGHGEH
jgi:mono/diheme cytochrome c family protein